MKRGLDKLRGAADSGDLFEMSQPPGLETVVSTGDELHQLPGRLAGVINLEPHEVLAIVGLDHDDTRVELVPSPGLAENFADDRR